MEPTGRWTTAPRKRGSTRRIADPYFDVLEQRAHHPQIDSAQGEGPDQDTDGKLARDSGHPEHPFEELATQLRGDQYHRELEDQPYHRFFDVLHESFTGG